MLSVAIWGKMDFGESAANYFVTILFLVLLVKIKSHENNRFWRKPQQKLYQ